MVVFKVGVMSFSSYRTITGDERVVPVFGYAGNKTYIADKIIQYFPEHTCYVELFFGSGSIFFNKPRAKYNVLNDMNDNVANVYLILQDADLKKQLISELEKIPLAKSILH